MRPLTVPQPVTTPSPGILLLSMPKSTQRCSTNMSNSSNEPLSSSSSMRSRAVSLPRLCCASMRFSPPPARAPRAALLELFEDVLHAPAPNRSQLHSMAAHRPGDCASGRRRQHRRGRLHLGEAKGAALERDLVAAP